MSMTHYKWSLAFDVLSLDQINCMTRPTFSVAIISPALLLLLRRLKIGHASSGSISSRMRRHCSRLKATVVANEWSQDLSAGWKSDMERHGRGRDTKE